MNSVSRVVVVGGLGFVVWGNAAAMDAYCVGHPQSWSCEDPRSPLPQPPDEMVQVTQMSTAKSTTVISTTAPSITSLSLVLS